MRLRVKLLATEVYLSQQGRPATLEELEGHRIIVWRPPSGSLEHLHLVDGGRLPVQPHLSSPDEQLLLRAAAAHKAIAYVPVPPFPAVEFPELVPVLPHLVGRSINGQMFVPDALEEVPRVKAILDAARAVATTQPMAAA